MAQCFLCEGLAVVYCVNEKAHLCASCDAQVHSDNFIVRQHKRRWLCNECGQRPGAVFCKTDLQHFCAECDTKVHAPGSKKARHDRVPADDVGALGEQPPQYQSHNAEASSSQYRPQASPMMNGSGSSGSRNDGGIHSLANHPILSALHTQQQSLPRAPADEEPFCYWDELLYARSQAAARQRRQPEGLRNQPTQPPYASTSSYMQSAAAAPTQSIPPNGRNTARMKGKEPLLVEAPPLNGNNSNNSSSMNTNGSNGIPHGSAPSPDSFTPLHSNVSPSATGSILQQSAQQSFANGSSSGSGETSFVLPPRTKVLPPPTN